MKPGSWPSAASLISGHTQMGLGIAAFLLVASTYCTIRNQVWQWPTATSSVEPPLGVSFAPPGEEGPAWPPPTQSLWSIISAGHPRSANRCAIAACPNATRSHKRRAGGESAAATCPDYFRWIHEDLLPWRRRRVTREVLEEARGREESFRVVVKGGALYVEPYGNCYQTRATFSIWGILQLLRFHPGLVPDVELVFGCGDKPAIPKQDFPSDTGDGVKLPPPVFRYCTTAEHFDIPFPDWSFWGWPEVNIPPWESQFRSIFQGSQQVGWAERQPTAFWKGNTFMGDGVRMELVKCHGHGAEILGQDWGRETHEKFRNSKLEDQCKHRYKVYVEGIGWSVSLKYILSCDSPVLVVDPVYEEFFERGLVAGKHYLPIPRQNMCPAISQAVDWGNNRTKEAQQIGKQGSRFMAEEVSMARVYDYMLHVLREYASLLDFEPEPRGSAVELCPEAFLCVAPPLELPMYIASSVAHPSSSPPCAMPPPDPAFLRRFRLRQQAAVQDIAQPQGASTHS